LCPKQQTTEKRVILLKIGLFEVFFSAKRGSVIQCLNLIWLQAMKLIRIFKRILNESARNCSLELGDHLVGENEGKLIKLSMMTFACLS
jgi:hypothetical protein